VLDRSGRVSGMLRKLLGFTLAEFLVTLTINLILFTALITIFLYNINHYRKNLQVTRLNQQLHTALMIMSNDIRRAGYWAYASNDVGTGQNNNPFMSGGLDISVNASNDCILFAYDHNSDGALPEVNSSVDDERYGFRLSGQAIQARPPGGGFACDSSGSSWENITDPNVIDITNLTFSLTTTTITTGPGVRGIAMRGVDVSVTGQLVNDSSITRTLTQHIRIRNDKFIP